MRRWQQYVDACQRWEAAPVISQAQFFARFVRPYLERKNKVCVLISDAFRYEVGEELQSLIRREDRFEAELVPALACLPSYTQLGGGSPAAAYDPGAGPGWQWRGTGGWRSATGSANRTKVLAQAVSASAVVLAKTSYARTIQGR